MRFTQYATLFLLVCLVGAGCVSRTTTRGRKLSELTTQSPGDNPRKVEHKTIWIWQGDFWRTAE